jgi:hypothetical protein
VKIMSKEYGLGRLQVTDLRDHKFALSVPAQMQSGTRYYNTGIVLNQGSTSQCVGYSSHKFLYAGPVTNRISIPNPQLLYNEARKVDEWAGEDYEGTSVRAVCKVLQRIGYIGEYNWAYDVPTCVNWLLNNGPMIFGTIWANDMFYPDKRGFIRVTGDVNGGHAYLIKGVNTTKLCSDGSRGAFRIFNSWGRNWGDIGRAWLSFTDARILLRENGEAVCAREIKI